MQQTPQPPQPPQPAQAPQPGTPAVAQYSNSELNALIMKRVELKGQLEEINRQREVVALQEKNSVSATPSQATLQARLQVLDERSARLEQDILRADDAIADAITRGLATPAQEMFTTVPGWNVPPGREAMNFQWGMLVLPMFLVIAGFSFWRIATRRAEKKFSRPAVDQSHRFEQLQQSVDVIALEVERIAEGQRYVTKLLNESLQPALGVGGAQPIEAANKSAAPATRKDFR
jgi:hypothetical protein